jgi:hypothetical protein
VYQKQEKVDCAYSCIVTRSYRYVERKLLMSTTRRRQLYMTNDGELIIPKNKVRVYDYIKNHPGSHLRKISKELDMATSDTQYWCNRLEKMALVRSRRLGLYRTYYPASTHTPCFKAVNPLAHLARF